MNWKLHIARHNTAAYAPAPAGGRLSFTLARPELYNLARDPDESYDVAGENPQIVEEIQRRIKTLLPGFPEQVQKPGWIPRCESRVPKCRPELTPGPRRNRHIAILVNGERTDDALVRQEAQTIQSHLHEAATVFASMGNYLFLRALC
jgi:hypothetical protein